MDTGHTVHSEHSFKGEYIHLGYVHVFRLDGNDMLMLSNLMKTSAENHSAVRIYIGQGSLEFVLDSNQGNAEVLASGVLRVHTNIVDLQLLAMYLHNMSYDVEGEIEESLHIHLEPSFILQTHDVKDIVFERVMEII